MAAKSEITLKTSSVDRVDDPFYDAVGCAAYLGRTERWVRRNVNEGNLPYVRMGRRLAFRRSALEAWIAENSVEPETMTAVRRRARGRHG